MKKELAKVHRPDTLAKLKKFSLTFLTVQTAQTVEFAFSNVAYRPTVYKTGPLQRC